MIKIQAVTDTGLDSLGPMFFMTTRFLPSSFAWRIARLSAEEKFSSLRRATLDNL